MSANTRYQALPSRMSLITFKTRLTGATKGHSLLKKKADALVRRHRDIQRILWDEKKQMVPQMKKSQFAVTSAVFVAGDISFAVQESLKIPAFKTSVRVENIAGVPVPTLTTDTLHDDTFKTSISGLGKGGELLKMARISYRETLGMLVKIASLQVAWVTLEVAMKVANRRVNALEKVVIPKIKGTIAYISSELDELEREEFFRLKMVQKKKKQAVARKIAEGAAAAAAAANDAAVRGGLVGAWEGDEDRSHIVA